MKNQNFIPDKVDPLDSDDSSILGEFAHEILVEDIDDLYNEDIPDDADSNYEPDSNAGSDTNMNDDSDNEDDSIGHDSASDLSNSQEGASGGTGPRNKTQSEAPHNPAAADANEDNSDCESTSSEEITATMQDIFGTKPNEEAVRNHPPNFKTNSPILDICFHPEADILAAGTIDGEGIIYRYNLEKVEEVARFSHHKKSCRQVCYNEDGTLLYTVSKDKSFAIVDTKNYAIKTHYKKAHEASIYSFCEISDGLCATGDDDGTVKLWDLRKSDPVMEFKCGEQTVTSLLACEAKKFLCATVADGSLTGFNIRSKRVEAQSEMFSSEFTCQSLVRGGTRLAVGSGRGVMYIFNWGDFGYKVDALSGHPDLIHCMAAITDKLILTGCEDGNIRAVHLYDHKFLGVVGQHKDFGVENLAVSCDGSLLASCSMDEEILFWNIEYLYDKKVKPRKSNKRAAVARNLPTSKKRNPKEFFRDIPLLVESDDDAAGPVPGTSYDSD